MKKHKTASPKLVMLGIVLLAFFISFILNSFITTGTYPRDLLDKHIQTEVLRADGSLDVYDSNVFDTVSRGDTIRARIYLPEEYYMEHPALCFNCYHCVVTLSYQGKVLYTYGQEILDKKQAIGAVHAAVEFPAEAFGSYLEFEAYATEDNSENRLVNFTLIPSTQALRYFVTGNLVNFIVFLACMVLGGFSFLAVLVYYLLTRRGREIMIVMGFIALISLYVLCYYGMINYISYNPKINSDLEYASLFLLPLPACAFFEGVFEKSRVQKFYRMGACVSSFVFLVCTLIHFSPFWWIHYTSMLTVVHVEILLLAILVIVSSLLYRSEHEWTQIIQYGTLLYAAIILAELFRFVISRFLPMPQLIYKFSLLPFSFLELIFTLLISTIVHQMVILKMEQERLQLKRLAYQDILTGLMSRTRCDEYCKMLEEEGSKVFTVFYVDLNGLKQANDKYGHEYGDKYLQKAAEILQDVFESADIISRMGGDEFVAIYGRDILGRIPDLYYRFDQAVKEMNESGLFPFAVSMACGHASSTPERPISVGEAMKLADSRMYEDKAAMKAHRE